MKQLDLTDIVSTDTRIVSGKDRGIKARAHFLVDSMDQEEPPISVILPEHIKVITPSFILGMFSTSVKKFGSVEGFFEHYKFEVSPSVYQQIVQGIRLGLNRGHALLS